VLFIIRRVEVLKKAILIIFILFLCEQSFYSVEIPCLGVDVKMVVVVEAEFSPYENFNPYDVIVAADGKEIHDFRMILQSGMESTEKQVKLTVLRSNSDLEEIVARFFPMKNSRKHVRFAKTKKIFTPNMNPNRLVIGIVYNSMLMVIKKDEKSTFQLDVGDMFRLNKWYAKSDLNAYVDPIINATPGDTLSFQVIKHEGLELLAKGEPEGDKYLSSDFTFTVDK